MGKKDILQLLIFGDEKSLEIAALQLLMQPDQSISQQLSGLISPSGLVMPDMPNPIFPT